MTWLWRICFSALLALPLPAAVVSGRVELSDSRDPGVRKKLDYSGVVIWLEPIGGGKAVQPAGRHAQMLQKGKTFIPHLLAIPVGTTVDFPNFDPIFHNAFSNYDGQIFDVGLYPPGSSRGIRFTRPGVVRIFCNIHAGMSAVLVVLDTPWFAVTGSGGRYVIPDVPPGEYTLEVFHERATPATLKALTRKLSVAGEALQLPPIAISESGYLPIPHQNKYGRQYPPAPDEQGVYPAVRK